MERETITKDECGRVVVPSDTANIWMSEMDLVELFGTTAPTLRAAIRAVYKSGALKQHEVERSVRLPDGYGMDVYALQMVMALAFRINTPVCGKSARCPIGNLVRAKRKTSPVGVNEQTDVRVLERGYVPTPTARRSDNTMLLRAFFFFPARFPYAIFCIFLSAGYDCSVPLRFAYQGFMYHAVTLHRLFNPLPMLQSAT